MRTTNPIKVGSTAALPVAGAAYEGEIRIVFGGGGVADKPYICLKTSAGGYAWVTLPDGDGLAVFGDITVTKITFA